jgi:hypothetical protein
MLHRPGVTQDLARFIVDTGWSEIPPDIAHEAKRALVNFFAVALAGCRGGPVARSPCSRSPRFPAARRRPSSAAASAWTR